MGSKSKSPRKRNNNLRASHSGSSAMSIQPSGSGDFIEQRQTAGDESSTHIAPEIIESVVEPLEDSPFPVPGSTFRALRRRSISEPVIEMSPRSSSRKMRAVGRMSASWKQHRKPTAPPVELNLAFKVLTEEQTTGVLNAAATGDVDQVQKSLEEILALTDITYNLNECILLDYYVAAVWWATTEQHYSREQLSAFYTVIHTLLYNIKDRCMTAAENLIEMKRMLIGIGMSDLPEGIIAGGLHKLFTVQQTKLIANYINVSLFQHHRLYEFFFHGRQAEQVDDQTILLEVPQVDNPTLPPPLCESISEEICRQYLKNRFDGQLSDELSGSQDEISREEELLAKLPTDAVCRIIDSVFSEMVTDFQDEVKSLVRDKENAFITRINKVHKQL